MTDIGARRPLLAHDQSLDFAVENRHPTNSAIGMRARGRANLFGVFHRAFIDFDQHLVALLFAVLAFGQCCRDDLVCVAQLDGSDGSSSVPRRATNSSASKSRTELSTSA